MLGVELRQSRFQRRFRAGMQSANTGGLGMHLVLQLARFPIRVEARVLLDFASEVITVDSDYFKGNVDATRSLVA